MKIIKGTIQKGKILKVILENVEKIVSFESKSFHSWFQHTKQWRLILVKPLIFGNFALRFQLDCYLSINMVCLLFSY